MAGGRIDAAAFSDLLQVGAIDSSVNEWPLY
jgi:hypothetical protein